MESTAFTARGVTVKLTSFRPSWVPGAAIGAYRALRRLLREAGIRAQYGTVKLELVDLAGKSHVEVIATITVAGASHVLTSAFSRYAPGALAGGFAETGA